MPASHVVHPTNGTATTRVTPPPKWISHPRRCSFYPVNIYNFIHQQTKIANSERKKNKQIEIIDIYATLTTDVQKNVSAQFIFSSKNVTSIFQNSTWQVKIKLHTAISNGF